MIAQGSTSAVEAGSPGEVAAARIPHSVYNRAPQVLRARRSLQQPRAFIESTALSITPSAPLNVLRFRTVMGQSRDNV